MSAMGYERTASPERCALDVCLRYARAVYVDTGETHEYCSYEHWKMDKRGSASE